MERQPGARARVAVVPELYGNVLSPCASIRLQSFFDRIRATGTIELRYLLPSELLRFEPDVVIWHRVSMPDEADLAAVRRYASARKAVLVYDIDDNLLDIEGHGEAEQYRPLTDAVRGALATVDEVWCSTAPLAARVARETDAHVLVMPNALDPDLWRPVSPINPKSGATGGPFRLLYMGTRTHDADYALLEEALDRLEAEQPGAFRLTLVGVRTAEGKPRPWLRIAQPPGHVGASYPAFVRWFCTLERHDLGLAPLLGGAFGDCKSSIKVMDYAAVGLPTLASRVPAYVGGLESGVDCLHVDNRPEAWAEAIVACARDPGRLDRLSARIASLVSPAVFDAAVARRADRLLGLASASFAQRHRTAAS